MAVFDFITNPPQELIEQAIDLNNQYFLLDTVSIPVLREWLSFNPYMDTYAMYHGRVHGFFNIIPLTDEGGELLLKQEILEEDLRTEHFLPHSKLYRARYAYFAAIAVKDTPRYVSRQCVAAMFSAASSLLLHHYGDRLEKILANPTTFQGNIIVKHMGMRPLVAYRKPLKGNDVYGLEMTDPAVRQQIEGIERRYAHLVGVNPWAEAA